MTALTDEVAAYLGQFDARLLGTTEGRIALTKLRPELFALVYLREHLASPDGLISFSEVHWDWADQAKAWAVPNTVPRAFRRAYVAPRSMGKSTWFFLILPLWAGAHGHKKFAIAFADAATQSDQHLATFKRELENNDLLRKDFPEFTTPHRRRRGVIEADSRSMYAASNGFTFVAKGIDSATLGAKRGAQRPDLLIFDDIEKPAGVYSIGQAASRLSTITDGMFPLNELASVVMVGTTTLPGGIMHQLVKSVNSTQPPAEWIAAEQVVTHYYDPIPTADDGTERSVWPEKWSLAFLNSIRHTRSYALNYKNDPMATDSVYWDATDFRYGPPLDITHTFMSLDPAVTSKTSSDQTGIAVIGYSNVTKNIHVLHAEGVRLSPEDLKDRVANLCTVYPDISFLYVETNQGGDFLKSALKDVPKPVQTKHQTAKKEVRASMALVHYQQGRVLHVEGLNLLEEQMVAFPHAAHDDLVDAVVSGVLHAVERSTPKAPKKKNRSTSY